MQGRASQQEGYRYGFNGKEDDTDFGNKKLIQDYGFRLYNPSIAKFLSVDPLTASYPWYTPYQFAGNKPIQFIDLDGLEEAKYMTTQYDATLQRASREEKQIFRAAQGDALTSSALVMGTVYTAGTLLSGGSLVGSSGFLGGSWGTYATGVGVNAGAQAGVRAGLEAYSGNEITFDNTFGKVDWITATLGPSGTTLIPKVIGMSVFDITYLPDERGARFTTTFAPSSSIHSKGFMKTSLDLAFNYGFGRLAGNVKSHYNQKVTGLQNTVETNKQVLRGFADLKGYAGKELPSWIPKTSHGAYAYSRLYNGTYLEGWGGGSAQKLFWAELEKNI